MKILAPACSAAEVHQLCAHGADEVYCGWLPPEWTRRFGTTTWLNRRGPAANLMSPSELSEMVAAAQASRARLYVTLNGLGYTAEQADFAEQVGRRALELGADALIVASVGLLRRLGGLPIHLSSLASCTNAGAVELFRSLGVTRIVLPRQVPLADVATLAAGFPGLELETFVLNDGCIYDEGSCATTHALGPFCLEAFEELPECRGRPLPRGQQADWERNQREYSQQLWANNNGGCRPAWPPLGPCGLCALEDLRRAGVAAVKIAGRQANPARKLASVQLVKAVLAAGKRGPSLARELRADPELCDSGRLCLFGSP